MIEETVKNEPSVGTIPAINSTYWYVRANMISHNFTVHDTTWTGGMSDVFRLTKGNVFLNEEDAYELATDLNDRMYGLRLAVLDARQQQMMAEQMKKQQEVKSLETDGGNKSKKEKSVHPDIIA